MYITYHRISHQLRDLIIHRTLPLVYRSNSYITGTSLAPDLQICNATMPAVPYTSLFYMHQLA